MSEWQPIETAPKDGTPIIVIPYGDPMDLQVSFWIADDDRWGNWEWLRPPTHWMPLPSPPKVQP